MAGIRHIEFWVSNMDRSLAFYEPVFAALGWEHMDANSFRWEGMRIYFREIATIEGVARGECFGPRHLCFGAENRSVVDIIAKHLQQSAVDVLHGPAELHPGHYMVVFKDPDGYILEVTFKK
jgi:catechol 2,3-dioxygenase-like lactoylglutathione lyase family enzyme